MWKWYFQVVGTNVNKARKSVSVTSEFNENTFRRDELYLNQPASLVLHLYLWQYLQHKSVVCILKYAFRDGNILVTHFIDVIMTTTASQITSLPVVHSTVHSDADQRKHQSSRHWPICEELTGTGEFPAQRASYAEYVPIWWRQHLQDHS